MNQKEVNKILEVFDRQIKAEYKFAEGDKEKCPSYWAKAIFLKTLHFTINDWKKVREGDYYNVIKPKRGIERSKFVYSRVCSYIGK